MLYSAAQLEQLWTKAGGPAKIAPTMAAIALAESGGDPRASNRDADGSVDRGLWQINSSHGYPAGQSFNPADNARQAVAVYRSQGLGAWSTYKSGAYRQFMPTAARGGGSGGGGSGGGSGRSGVAFAQKASQYIGRPYAWGGSSPKGFDCSGLVFYVLTQMGLRGVPRTSEAQFPWTKRVSPAQLQVGDLVFLNFPGELSPGHVMIYLGGNQVLQAPGRGQNVGTAIFDPQKPGSNEWGATVVGYGRVPGLTYAGEPAGPLSMPSTLGASVPASSRPRPGADNSGLLDTIGSWFSGAAGAVAGTALDGVFPGLGEAVDEIGSPLDFLKLALWLLHPKTWLRAFEVLLGLAIIGLSLRGLFLIFASRDTPVDFETVGGAARSLHQRTIQPAADRLIPGNRPRRNQRRKRKSTAAKAAGLAAKYGEVPF